MPEWIGQTIGKVRIEKFLSRGGMAEVYLGTHITLARPVAVKVLHSFREEEYISLARFMREARVVAAMRHPNIVQIYDFDITDGHPYMVMEYLKGPTLEKYLQKQRKQLIPHSQVARLLNGLAAALEYAHARGVIHRDVKPANILLHNKTDEIPLDKPLPEDVEAVLTDFGLVRLVDTDTHTTSDLISGTPAYMSPEQARGDKNIDHRSDIYSLGIVLYELLAGRVPFTAEHAVVLNMEIHQMQIHALPPPIPELPARVQAVLDCALAKNPADRYPTSGEMASDFARAAGLSAERVNIQEPVKIQEPEPAPLVPAPPPIQKRAPSEPSSSKPRLDDQAANIMAILISHLAAAGQEFAKEPDKAAEGKIGALYNTLKTLLGHKPSVNKALTALEAKPRDKKAQTALEHQLRSEMKNDRVLAVTVEKLIAEIRQDKALVTFLNQFQGAQIDKVIQIGDVDNLTIN
jgi:serine/threonine protein kinase